MEITSTSNSRVKEWKKLNNKKRRKKQNKYILDGLHLVKEALKANKKVEELLITSKFEHLNEIEIPDETKVIMISEEVSKSISETQTPQGIFGIVSIEEEKITYPQKDVGAWLMLDGVQDPGNIGTMVRTADAAGFSGVILGEGSADLYNPKVVRAMQGSQFHIKVINDNLSGWIRHFKDMKVPVFGSELNEHAREYTNVGQHTDFALVMGNEGNGMSKEILEMTSINLYIPITNAESLNVAVAAGILMFALKK